MACPGMTPWEVVRTSRCPSAGGPQGPYRVPGTSLASRWSAMGRSPGDLLLAVELVSGDASTRQRRCVDASAATGRRVAAARRRAETNKSKTPPKPLGKWNFSEIPEEFH